MPVTNIVVYETKEIDRDIDLLHESLLELGNQGWELCSTIDLKENSRLLLIFKRIIVVGL